MSDIELVSTEPATGAILWRGACGNVDAEVTEARASWPAWAAQPLSYRAEALRRFANVVRARGEDFADLIARETYNRMRADEEELTHPHLGPPSPSGPSIGR